MAKTVSDIFLKLNVEGKEALEKLKSSFRTLDRTIGVSNKAIEQLRQETLSFGSSSRVTIASIKGQIEALKGLQQQSTVNSGTYKRLTEDINKLNEQLGKLDGTVTTVKRNLGSFQVPGYKPDSFATAIQARRTELQGLAIDSKEYLNLLTGITAYERRQSFIGGRQQAAAAAGAAARPMPARATAVELPSTVAGLRQRMSELNFEVDNLELNSDQLRSAQRELTQVQQELNEALGGTSSVYQQLERQENAAIRRAEKLAGIQEYYATQGAKAPGAGGYRDPVTGAMIARGTVAGRRPLPVERPMREISGLYQQIGQIGMSGITADIERMGKGYREVADDILAASIASNGSITSLQAQRSAWVSLSATLNPASREYREVGRQIDRVERRLDRLTKKQKLSTRIKGNLGAAAAGAIFGGPEAAIGGLVAGPLGAGAGATASMARQGLGEFASYAAEIEKLQIALEGVTKTQDAYIYSLETARKATTDFNIPIDQSTRNITRLSAAVLGAGGNVGDAELVFRNVTAAVKATGGSADDVNSAITAMVQVFSKGKVSAEELSGQLGERLPGAVTLFAKAVYGDGHDAMIQLQDDLKAGTVGLNELMKFAQALGVEYTDLAKQIADSTADAGAKAKVAFDQARLEIGKALQPIGAELQTAIADFLVQNQAEIIAIAKTLSQVFAGLLDVLAFLVRNFEELAAVAAVVASTAGLIKVVAVVKSLGGVAAVASMAMGGLTASITGAGIAASALATGGVALLIGGFAALTIGLYNAAFGHSKFVEEVANGDQPMKEAREELAKLNDTLEDYQERLENAVAGQGALRLSQQIAVLKGQIQELNEAMEVQAYAKKGKGFVGPLPLTGDPDADQARFRRYSRTTFPGITPDGKDGKGKETRPMLMEELRLRQELRRQKEEGTKISALEAQYNLDVYMAKLETKDLNKRQNMIEDARHKLTMAIAGEMDGMLKIAEEHQSLTQDINKELEDRKYKLGLISEEEYKQFEIAREKARLEEKYKGPEFAGKRAELADLYRREVDPTFKEGAETEVARMERDLEKMTKPLEQLKGAAMAFGESISQAFSNIVTGSQTAQQAMASFLKNLGQYFVEYAAKVITQMIAIATIQAVIKALGGPSTGGGDAGPKPALPGSVATIAAQGTVMDKGVKRYAMGGVVNKPTMFTYAEGGTGRFGLMGEAGPEAIIPLKRGNDGRLGVSAYFADANAAMAKGAANRSSSAAFEENADVLAMSTSYVRERNQERERQTMLTGAGGSMLIQTQVINNVEYATMDQVAQATAAGAKQARAQVFADMRNKPSTRSSLGMR
jgi:lambda family phage tail tape measure protein